MEDIHRTLVLDLVLIAGTAVEQTLSVGLQVPLSMALLNFGMGTMLANLHMCGIMLV